MAADPYSPDDEFDPPAPSTARRIGYSSRGRASPVGEADDAPPLTLSRPGEQERNDQQQADGLRRSYDTRKKQQERDDTAQEKAAAGLAKKSENARREAEFRSKGQKFYTDSFSDLQPEVDEAGQPRFQASTWKKTEVAGPDGTKSFALARRNESGKQEVRAPKIVPSADLKDPQLYQDFGAEGREAIGHVDDLARSGDPEIARVAGAHRLKRNAALRTDSLKPLRTAYDAAAAEVGSAQLSQRQLDEHLDTLNKQIGAIDSDPTSKATSGGFIGIGSSPTPDAARMQAQRASLQTQRDELSKKSADLRLSTEKGGALERKQAAAKLELDLWGHQSKVGELDDLAKNRRAFLRTQKRSEKDDPVLAQILTQQEAFGAKASQTAALRKQDDELVVAGRTAGEAAPIDAAQFGTAADAHRQQAAAFEEKVTAFKTAQKSAKAPDATSQAEATALETERRTLLQDREKLNAWSGRIVEARDKEATAAVSEIQKDRDNFKPDFFVGNWSKLFSGDEAKARDQRMEKVRGDAKAALKDDSVSALGATEKILNYVGAIVSTPLDIIRGRTLKDIDAQERHEQAKQLIGDFKGQDALKVLRLQNEFSAKLARGDQIVKAGKTSNAEETLRNLGSADSLASLQSLHDMLKTDDGTSPVLGGIVGTREISKAVLQVASLINAVPGVAVDFKSLGIDTKDPEKFAQHAALARAVAEQIKEKYSGSALAGMVAGSLDQFLAMNAVAAPVAGRAVVAGKRTDLVRSLGGVKTAAERAQLWIASAGVGSAQSFYENPSMSFAGRWVDIIGNTIPLAVGEMAGNKLEHVVTGGLPTKLGAGKLAAATAARVAGGTAGEVMSDVVQGLVQGQPFDGQLADSLSGNLGAVLAMGLIRGAGEAIPLRQARQYAQRLTAMRSEVGNRVADIRSVLDLARQDGPEGERARTAIAALPAGAVENFEQVVSTLPAGPVESAADPGKLRGQNALRLGRIAFAGAYAEAMQQRLAATTGALTQIDAAPDFVQVDEETGQPVPDVKIAGANRDAARALVRIGNGTTTDQLTEAETQSLELVGEQIGSEMVRDVGGEPVITDAARAWALDLAPAASRIIRQSEAERVASITTAANQPADTTATTSTAPNEKVQGQKEKGLLSPAPSVAPAAESSRLPAEGASLSFTNAAGKTAKIAVPANATVPSTGAPVRDNASAEQWLAETQAGPVRDVQFSAPAKPNAGKAVAPAKTGTNVPAQNSTGTVSPGALLPRLKTRLRAKGVKDADIARTAVDVAKRVNAAANPALFGGRIKIVDKAPVRSGGVLYDPASDSLVISLHDLADDAETLRDQPERIAKLVREEAIHRAAVRLEKRGAWDAGALWNSITPATQEAFTRAYHQGRNDDQPSWNMGHEMVRMLVQGRLAVRDGKLSIDGAALSEETASPTLVAKLADILRRIRDYFSDLAGSLKKDGNSPETIAEIQRVVDQVSRQLVALENIAKAKPAATTNDANTAANVTGEKIAGEWVAFAPESGTLGLPRAEMPQFGNESLGALTQFLAARGIGHATTEVLPGTLKPTQAEYSTVKVEKTRKKAEKADRPRSILVSSDNYILDRHHQFIVALEDAPQTPVQIIRFAAPIKTLLDVVADFPGVEYSSGATSPNQSTPEPTANAPTTGLKSPDVRGTAPAPASPSPESRQVRAADVTPDATLQNETPALAATVAQGLGISPEQVGRTETVTHKGRTVRVANVVLDASQLATSHTPDGTVNPDYPQEYQPRDRSAAIYRDQQRRIAAQPNLAEEFLSGTPDRGTPIVVSRTDGTPFVLIGNGRANAKAQMYAAPDLAATADKFKQDIAARAAEKGLTPEAVANVKSPVLVRLILDDLSPAELRAFSQASNEFSGAATNAIEQAKVDASRLTPGVVASLDPEFDLDAAKNEPFRREFVRTVIGRAENITGPDLRRRVQAALFAKAFGATEDGIAAFSRLAGEDDEGVKNLVRAMLDTAPAFAAMQDRIAAGTLNSLDLAPALTRAVQDIAVTLREKPAKQTADVALDSLVNQTDLAIEGKRAPINDAVLRFLVENRRNRSDISQGLSAYVSAVYAEGDPNQANMFGEAPRTTLEVFKSVAQPVLASVPARLTTDNATTPVNFQVTDEQGNPVGVQMPAGKAAKMLREHVQNLSRVLDCLGKAIA